MMFGTTLFCVINFFCCINALSCTQSPIEIYGAFGSDYESFNNYISTLYSTHRKAYGINVVIKRYLNESFSKSMTEHGLIGSPGNPPVVFANTAYKIDLNKNEDKIPLFAHGIAIFYNLPGINALNLTANVIANIYMNYIQHWDDASIAMYNPNVSLPHQLILPVVRMDEESSTAFFTKLLSANDEVWKNKYGTFSSPEFYTDMCCNSTRWPSNNKLKFANEVIGMVGIVLSYQYTIGYAVAEAVNQYNIKIASLLKTSDSEDNAIQPTMESIRKVMTSFLNDSSPEDYHINSDTIYNGSSAYPLTGFSSFVINYTYDNSIDCCIIQELVGFLDWFYGNGMNDFLLNQGYVPIIQEISDRVIAKVLPKITCKNELVYYAYMKTKTMDKSQNLSPLSVTIIIVSCSSITMVLAFSGYIYYNRHKSNLNLWLVDANRINILEDGTENKADSEINSVMSSQFSNLLERNFTMVKAVYDGNKVHLNALSCKAPIHWSRITRRNVLKMKSLTSRHVVKLFGVTNINAISFTIFEYCSNGTLHFVLKTTRYTLTNEIKQLLALDAANGMVYLHKNKIVHGFLSSLTCNLDTNWVLKITGYEKLLICVEEGFKTLKEETYFSNESILDTITLIRLLYIDKSLLTDMNEKSDVFLFGLLLLEIFSRELPYNTETINSDNTYTNILNEKFNKYNIVKPNMVNLDIINEIMHIISICIENDSESRPNISTIQKILTKFAINSKSIVDHMMESVEKHADLLEKVVEERTAELKKITNEMKNLLNEVLPPQIAAQLLAGNIVTPEQFECVTIYFSDIVGFTSISSRSSPIDIMAFLNDLWLVFDNAIENFDAYKVDTIGDAYMVCSGLPMRNGMNHCQQIALLALELKHLCSRYKVACV